MMSYSPQGYPGPNQPATGAQSARQYGHDPRYDAQGHYQGQSYGEQGYGGPGAAPKARSNPLAGVLLLIGAVAALVTTLVPVEGSDVPVFSAVELVIDGADGQLALLAWAIIGCALGGLLCLFSAFPMFSAGRHGAAATLGLLGALLMIAAAVTSLVIIGGLDDANWSTWLFLLCGIPALLGALLGFRR